MTFFNNKEEVIDIELTQYGKNLLTRGKFKPVFYAFFDDDIIYDSTYAGFSEIQNKIEDRIKNETPRSHTQHVFTSIENNIAKQTPSEGADDAALGFEAFAIDPNIENEYALGVPLGNSSISSEYAPAWDVQFLYGKIDDYKNFMTGSTMTAQVIPQLDTTIEYESYVTKIDQATGLLKKDYIPDNLKTVVQLAEDPRQIGVSLQEQGNLGPEDLEVIQIKPDFFLLEVLEENTDFQIENFDIEVFLLESEEDKKNNKTITHQRQLFFYDPKQGENVNKNHVEYYFDLDVDSEILADYFCASQISSDKQKSILADGVSHFNCPDIKDVRDLYTKKLEDVEDC